MRRLLQRAQTACLMRIPVRPSRPLASELELIVEHAGPCSNVLQARLGIQEMRCTGVRLSHPTARPVECIGAPLRKASLGGESLVQPLLLGTATMSWRGHQRKRQKWLLQASNLITPHCPTG